MLCLEADREAPWDRRTGSCYENIVVLFGAGVYQNVECYHGRNAFTNEDKV
jgi:hypothetical protein